MVGRVDTSQGRCRTESLRGHSVSTRSVPGALPLNANQAPAGAVRRDNDAPNGGGSPPGLEVDRGRRATVSNDARGRSDWKPRHKRVFAVKPGWEHRYILARQRAKFHKTRSSRGALS